MFGVKSKRKLGQLLEINWSAASAHKLYDIVNWKCSLVVGTISLLARDLCYSIYIVFLARRK